MSICDNNILEVIGSFAGLSMKDDRRYKKRTTGAIRIRGLNRRLNHWAPIYEPISNDAIQSHNEIGSCSILEKKELENHRLSPPRKQIFWPILHCLSRRSDHNCSED